MATYILVHGGSVSTETWNRLTGTHDYPEGGQLGGACWRYSVLALEKAGHRVFAPDLADENTHGLSEHIEQICTLIREHDLRDVILVGHSYGGMVITGVAAALPERIGTLVYLDADFPDPGQSLFDTLSLAGFDPERIVGGRPAAYTEKLRFDPTPLDALNKVYILCTQSEFSAAAALMVEKIDFSRDDWRYFELPTVHFAQASMPDALNAILLDLA